MNKWVGIGSAVLTGLLLVALAVVVLLQQGRINDLSASLKGTQAEVGRLSQSTVTSELTDLKGVVAELKTMIDDVAPTVTMVVDCVPELEDQIQSMEVNYGYAYPNTNVSRQCSDFLYGVAPPGGGGE